MVFRVSQRWWPLVAGCTIAIAQLDSAASHASAQCKSGEFAVVPALKRDRGSNVDLGTVCCAADCNGCGGADCVQKGGGDARRCCLNPIRMHSLRCRSDVPAPCCLSGCGNDTLPAQPRRAAPAQPHVPQRTPVHSPPSGFKGCMPRFPVDLSSRRKVHQPTAFVLLHTQHEGSHAISQEIAEQSCVTMCTKEQFDSRHFNDDGGQTAQRLVRGLLTGSATLIEEWSRAFISSDRWQSGNETALARAELQKAMSSRLARGLLLRRWPALTAREVLQWHRDLLAGSGGAAPNPAGLSVFVLLRADLMRCASLCLALPVQTRSPRARRPRLHPLPPARRWALSRYDSPFDASLTGPNAAVGVTQFTRKSMFRHAYDIGALAKAVEQCIADWRNQLNFFVQLIEAGLTPRLIVYEQWFAAAAATAASAAAEQTTVDGFGGRAPLPGSLQGVLEEISPGPCEVRKDAARQFHVRRVHSCNVGEFAVNADEIERHFNTTKYVTLADVMDEVGLPHGWEDTSMDTSGS